MGRWSEECCSLQAEAGLGKKLAGKQFVLVFPGHLWGLPSPQHGRDGADRTQPSANGLRKLGWLLQSESPVGLSPAYQNCS